MPAVSMSKLKRVQSEQKKRKDKNTVTAAQVAATADAVKTGSETPKWYSPDGTDIHVALPDGRKAIVGEEPRELPRAFFRAATRAGCLATTQLKPSDMNVPVTPDNADPLKRAEKVYATILEAAQAEEDDEKYANAFTPAGLPNVKWLTEKCGFVVSKEERDAAWNQIQREIEESEGDDEGQDAAREGRDDA